MRVIHTFSDKARNIIKITVLSNLVLVAMALHSTLLTKSEARGTSVVLRHHLGGGQAAQEKVEGALSSMVTNHLG